MFSVCLATALAQNPLIFQGIFFYQCRVSSVTLECVRMSQDLTNIYYQQATLSLSIHSYSFLFTLQSTKRIFIYIYKNDFF